MSLNTADLTREGELGGVTPVFTGIEDALL